MSDIEPYRDPKPATETRVWDEDWKLVADSTRGDDVKSALLAGRNVTVDHPNGTRWSGKVDADGRLHRHDEYLRHITAWSNPLLDGRGDV